MSHITDEDIKSLLNQDADKAFRMIIDLYGSKLYWHIRRIVIIHDDADDALQNTFINAWKNIAGFRFESSLLTWLWSIATNEALTLIRKRERQSAVSLDDLDGIFAQAAQGTLIAIHSTVNQASLLRWAKEAADLNLKLIDAPITGGSDGAAAGTLCYMVGGSEEDLAEEVIRLRGFERGSAA